MGREDIGKPTVSVSQASEMLGMDRVAVWRSLKAGELKGFQQRPGVYGSKWCVYVYSVESILAARAEQSA